MIHKMRFTKRTNKKTGKITITKSAGQPVATPAFRKKVLSIVKGQSETKYVATDIQTQTAVATLIVPAGLQKVLPPLALGVQSNQRIGQKISNAHGRVDFHFYLTPSPEAQSVTNDVYVKIFKLTPKQAKSYTATGALTNNTLLDTGLATSTDWILSGFNAFAYNTMPLSKEDFSGSIGQVRLVKNQGAQNDDPTALVVPNMNKLASADFSYSWKHKGAILYDDVPGNTYPTNLAPVFGIVAYNADNSVYGGRVQYYTRLHMWFKDV